MAVGLQLPPFSKSSSWALANPIQLSDTPPDSMTSAMSYQYSLPSGPGPGPHLENHPLNSLNNYHLPAVTSLPPPQSLHPHNQKPPSPIRRGSSVGQKQDKMKRSVSTPNVLGQARQDQAESSLSAEKRRNKLGYHRTSVACGHCRRRKIRCIPAPGDSQNRCSNCIRLKKECKFYAVDQQPQSDQRRDSDVQGASTSSSPNPSAQPSSMQGLSYTHLAMPPVQELGSSDLKGARPDSFSPEDSKGPFSRPQEYGQTSAGWIPNDSTGLAKGGAEVAPSFWRMNSQESPLATGFSPYSPNIQQLPQSNWPPAHQDPVVREEMGWSVPQRSMSYNTHETLRHNSTYGPFHQSGLTSNVRDDFVPRPQQSSQTDIYAPSLTPGAHSISGTEASSTSTAAEVQTPQHSSIPLPPPFTVQSTPSWQPSYSYGNSKAALPGNEPIGWYYPSSAPHEVAGDGLGLSYAHSEPYATLHGYPSVTQGGGR